MTDAIEDAIVSAAHAKGFALNSAVMGVAAVDLAGSKMVGDLISIPNKGSISVENYLHDLHDRAPSGFSRLEQPDRPDDERTVSQLRRKRPLDAAWHARRASATGITRAHMNDIASRRAGQ